MIKQIHKNRFLLVPLFVSLLFFVRKGVQYALIGSYIPLFVVTVFLSILSIYFKSNRKTFMRVVKVWAILMIVWSSVRIFISMMNYFTNTFDEYHLTSQFGIGRLILSLVMLLFGIMIFRASDDKKIDRPVLKA